MTVLPRMPPEQTSSWLGILDLYEQLSEGWTLIGGQLVHLHFAERGTFPVRPTNDADTVIDVRADPDILHTFTRTLEDLGFTSAGISAEGRQHRWVRDQASIDVLLPEGIGERASERQGVTGSPTLPTEGGTQATSSGLTDHTGLCSPSRRRCLPPQARAGRPMVASSSVEDKGVIAYVMGTGR